MDGQQPIQTPLDHFIGRLFARLRWLSPQTLRCRYCNGQIQEDTNECPHCWRWLTTTGKSTPTVAPPHEMRPDPWEPWPHNAHDEEV